MAATIAANLMGDRNVGSALVFAVCNAGEALIIATLIERYFGTPFGLDRLSHVIGFLGAAVAGTVARPSAASAKIRCERRISRLPPVQRDYPTLAGNLF